MDHAHSPHYHIRWYDQAVLDWERFSTPEDATARAKLLAAPRRRLRYRGTRRSLPTMPGYDEPEICARHFQRSQCLEHAQ